MAVFICADEDTEKWLKVTIPGLDLGEFGKVRLVLPEELLKRKKMTVLVPPPKKKTQQLLRLLERQNAEITPSEWIVHKREEVQGGTLLVLCIDEASHKVLKARHFKAYQGTHEVIFRV